MRVSATGEDGFTLVELVAVLAVLAIVTGIVAPRFSAAISSASLDAAAQNMAGVMNRARMLALTQTQPVDVEIGSGTLQITGDAQAIRLPEDIRLQIVSAAFSGGGLPARIRFYPDGSATGGRISLSRHGRSDMIEVNWLTGHATWRRG